MHCNFLKFLRKSLSIRGGNHTSDDYYFITFCTQVHRRLFGKIIIGRLHLNEVARPYSI